jgi:beta-aspartyl-peptidase (threonine type)
MVNHDRRIAASAVWLMLLAGLVDACCSRAEAAEPDPVSAVRAVLDRQVADWNKHDLDAFLAGYWNSPKLVFQSGGRRVDGWEPLRERYKTRYQAEGRSMGQLEFGGLDIEPLAPGVVLVRGTWRVTMPDGAQPHGLFTLVFRQFPEGWKIVHDHTSADDATAPRPAVPEKKSTQ